MKTIGERLRYFAENNFKLLNDFSKAMGVKTPALYNYFNNKNEPGSSFLFRLAELGCDINWLLTGHSFSEKDTYLINEKGTIDNSKIKKNEFLIEATIPAGIADINERAEWNETERLDFNPQTHFFLEVDKEFGDSMLPSVQPGDLVLCSTNVKPKVGDMVAAKWDDTKGALKTYSRHPDMPDFVLLTSYNPNIPVIFVRKDKLKAFKVVLIKKR